MNERYKREENRAEGIWGQLGRGRNAVKRILFELERFEAHHSGVIAVGYRRQRKESKAIHKTQNLASENFDRILD